jgi:GTP-binding protein
VKIRSVEFAGAVARPGDPAPAALPQIAFSGRSNVGKSSLINRVLGRTRKQLARVSATPGKTQQINFYRVRADVGAVSSTQFLLADLPGYGFAQVPLGVRHAWRPLIESYLSSTAELRGVVQLIDIRRDPHGEDQKMLEFLAELGLPTLVVLTKADKLPPSQRNAREAELIRGLDLDAEQVVAVSAQTGDGCEALSAGLDSLLTGETQ